jgi:hypothetical protein
MEPAMSVRLMILAVALLAQAAASQVFSMTWSTVDGGGATSSSANFSMSGTIGQHDAQALAFTPLSPPAQVMVGGFWGPSAPPPCPSDFDRTGFVDSDDFVYFLLQFSIGCVGPGEGPFGPEPQCTVSADFDGSGFVDVDDFVAYLNMFASGC